jgi:nucleotide-binding universal stress UspA family protein
VLYYLVANYFGLIFGTLLKHPQSPIKKIVLLTDFTDASTDASYHALLLAKTYKAEIKALHVFNPKAIGISDENYQPAEHFISKEDPRKTRQRGKDTLNELAESFHTKIETIFSEGFPGQETIRITSQLDTNLIVLGAQSYTRWNKFIGASGSVAEYIVKYAPCAVFSIRQGNLDKASFPNETEYSSHKKANALALH